MDSADPFKATSYGAEVSATDLHAQRTAGIGRAEQVPARRMRSTAYSDSNPCYLRYYYRFDYHGAVGSGAVGAFQRDFVILLNVLVLLYMPHHDVEKRDIHVVLVARSD